MEKEIKTTDNKAAINRLTKYIETMHILKEKHANEIQGKGGRK
jgi:hypothetical protein